MGSTKSPEVIPSTDARAHPLTPSEIESLLQGTKESIAWAQNELKRRRQGEERRDK